MNTKNEHLGARWIRTEGSAREIPVFQSKEQKSACRRLATLLNPSQPKSCPLWRFPILTEIEVSDYRFTSKIHWPINGGNGRKTGEKVIRDSQKQSVKSRLNCAFNFVNASRDFESMVLLSWPGSMHGTLDYNTVKSARKRFLDVLRLRFPDIGYGWFLEFGSRSKSPHFHIFLTHVEGSEWCLVTRKTGPVEILKRPLMDWFVDSWMDCSQITSPRSRNLNYGYEHKGNYQGGMVERLRSPESAGRYAAKEASKAVQKHAPWPVKQWWQLSRNLKPTCDEKKTVTVLDYLKTSGTTVMVGKCFQRVTKAQN